MFRKVPLSIVRSFPLYTQQWYMSYSFADSLQAGSGRNILILLASCQQTCMTYTIAMYAVENSRLWTEELSEICRVSFPNKFEKLVHLVGFIIRKFLYRTNALHSCGQISFLTTVYLYQFFLFVFPCRYSVVFFA